MSSAEKEPVTLHELMLPESTVEASGCISTPEPKPKPQVSYNTRLRERVPHKERA